MPKTSGGVASKRFRERLGARIEAAREKASLESKELAKLVGVGPPMVTDWRKGRKCPSAENVVRIARATKQPITFLLPDGPEGGSLEELCRDLGARIGSRRMEAMLALPQRVLKRHLDRLIGRAVAEGQLGQPTQPAPPRRPGPL